MKRRKKGERRRFDAGNRYLLPEDLLIDSGNEESLEQMQEENNEMFEGETEPLATEDRVDWFDETLLRAEELKRR